MKRTKTLKHLSLSFGLHLSRSSVTELNLQQQRKEPNVLATRWAQSPQKGDAANAVTEGRQSTISYKVD